MTRFGAADDVIEPAAGAPKVRGPGLHVRSCLSAPDCAPQLSQDWTMYARADRLAPAGLAAPSTSAGAALQPPRCTLTVRYGVDAASFSSTIAIPASGLALHVSGDWIAADIDVYPSAFEPLPSETVLRCTLAAVPASAREGAVAQRVPFLAASLAASAPFLVDVPAFATGVSGLRTVQSVAGALTSSLARGTWHYRSTNSEPALALTAPQLLTSATLNTFTPSSTTGELGGILQSEGRMSPALPPVRSAGVAVPAGANALALDVGPSVAAIERGAFDLQWLIQS